MSIAASVIRLGGPGRIAGFAAAVFVAVCGARAAQAASPYDALLATEGARLAAHPGEAAAVSALAVLVGLDELVAPPALEAALRPAVAPGAHPLVAAQAAFTLARLLDQRGETREAAALRAPLGLFAHWFVIGPFGEGRASFGTRFPPETERAPPELGHAYPGKLREVGWRAADAAVRDGVLYLDGMLRPDTQAVAYAVVYVRSDRARAAALRLGSAGPIKVWWNGAEVLARDVVRPAALDQDAVGVRMARGWNRLLIKTVVTDNAWRLYARLTEPSGAPLPGLRDPRDRARRRGRGGAERNRAGARRGAARGHAGRAARPRGPRGRARVRRGLRPGSIGGARSPGSRRATATRTRPPTPSGAHWRRSPRPRWRSRCCWPRPTRPTPTTSAAGSSSAPSRCVMRVAGGRARPVRAHRRGPRAGPPARGGSGGSEPVRGFRSMRRATRSLRRGRRSC